MERSIGAVLLIILLGANAGCSVIESILKRTARAKPETEVTHARSALDSVWASGAPVDTVFLKHRPAGPAALPAENLERRRAPAALEIGKPELVAGYRVQLASSTNRGELEALVRRVEREFGSTAYLEEHEGFFTLRIGAFLDR